MTSLHTPLISNLSAQHSPDNELYRRVAVMVTGLSLSVKAQLSERLVN
jgi:hypothetical protein